MELTVEITGATRETLWYAAHVGSIVDVTEHDEEYYRVIYQGQDPTPYLRYLILKKDCEVIK